MRAFSIGALVLALLGRTTSFVFSSPAAVARLRNPAAAAARPNNARINKEKVPLPWATSASSARPPALSWPHPFAVRGGGRALRATDEPASAEASPRPALDVLAIGKYIAGTAVEFGIIMGLLTLLQGQVLPRLAAKWAKVAVFFTFGFLAMKSRTFAVINARRPTPASEKEAKVERRRPDWMPPPKVFPFIWITIGILRAVSTTLVWEALGRNLVTAPVAAMVLHLSIGDTWNHINNVEKRLGVAVSVVFLVWLSVANAVFRYYQALPKAGLVLLPSLIWITVANLLVQSIWRLNGKEPLYPAKQA